MKGKVPIICPVCAAVTFADSLEKINEIVHKQWQMLLEFGGAWADAYKEQAATIGTYNNPKKIRKAFEEKGYVTMFCPKCMADTSQKMYEAQGMEIVRIGNYLFDKKFFIENEELIRKKLLDTSTTQS